MIIKFSVDENNRFKITEPEHLKGKLLPIGFLTGKEHSFVASGYFGEVEVPTSVVANGEVNVIGITEESWEQAEARKARQEFLDIKAKAIRMSGPSQEWIDQPEGFQLFTEEESKEVLPVEDLTNDDEVFPEDTEIESLPSILEGHNKVDVWEVKEGPVKANIWEGSDGYADTPDSRIAKGHSVIFGQPLPTYPTQPALIYEDAWGDSQVSTKGLLYELGFRPRPNKNGSVHRWYHPVLGDDKPDNHLLFDLDTDSMDQLGVKIFRLGAKLGTRALKLQIKNTLEQH